MTILVNLLALLLMGFIVWWFWLAKSRELKAVTDTIDIVVEGGVYTPATIEVNKGDVVKLNFVRRDASPCAEKVIFSGLEISEELPLKQSKQIKLQVQQSGEYEFTCQMGMYRGKLIVK